MEEQPNSVESKLLLAQMQQKRSYPFLRAVRWLLRFGVLCYLVTSLILALMLIGGRVSQDMAEVIAAWGGAEKGTGVFAAFILLIVVALRSSLLIAASEAIQLLLDLRETQLETSRPPP